MGSGDLPEGLEELGKREEPIGRREMEATYEELFEEAKDPDMDRRTLLSMFAGGGGLALFNGLFAQKLVFGDDLETGVKAVAEATDDPIGVTKTETPTYEVDDDVFERHSGLNDF